MFKKLSLFIILSCLPSFILAEVPVEAHSNPAELLESYNPNLRKNKKLVYDFYRLVLRGWRLDQVDSFLQEGYIQHNPNVKTGRRGFKDFLSKIAQGKTRPIPEHLDSIVSIQAEGDMVTLSFVRKLKDSAGRSYSTTWFDMFRVNQGKIAEHWDNATLWK